MVYNYDDFSDDEQDNRMSHAGGYRYDAFDEQWAEHNLVTQLEDNGSSMDVSTGYVYDDDDYL